MNMKHGIVARTLALIAGLAASLAGSALAGSHLVYEYREVTVDGKSQCQSKPETAAKYANLNAKNRASRACRALGQGWGYDRPENAGQEKSSKCRDLVTPNGTMVEVSQQTHRCKHLDRAATIRQAKGKSPANPPQEKLNLVRFLFNQMHGLADDQQRAYIAGLPAILSDCLDKADQAACKRIDTGAMAKLRALPADEQRTYRERLPQLFESCLYGKNEEACEAIDRPSMGKTTGPGVRG